jgi:uncharacterized membrane protein
MSTDNGEEPEVKEEKTFMRLERINGFSDAVFAVAITLLILTIDVPVVSDASELGSELSALWPKFLGFLISFAIIGFFWVAHHLIFNYLEQLTPGLLWLNLFFLLFIVILPFSTELMSEYNSSNTALMFYNSNMALASLLLFLLWLYMSHDNRLIDEDFDPALRKHILLIYFNMTIIFLISVAVAAVNAVASQYVYMLLIPNSFVLERLHRKEKKKAAAA